MTKGWYVRSSLHLYAFILDSGGTTAKLNVFKSCTATSSSFKYKGKSSLQPEQVCYVDGTIMVNMKLLARHFGMRRYLPG
ncbi:hypothetical protein JOM56_006934 [Amanita muscaria]